MALSNQMATQRLNCVYRYYDKAGRLIYVGVTVRGVKRQQEHNESSEWFQYVADQQVEQCGSREESLRVERELIRVYRPPFNTVHNENWESLRAAYLGIVAAEEAYARAVGGAHLGIAPCDPCACSGPGSDPCEYGKPVSSVVAAEYEESGCRRAGCQVCHARFHGIEEGLPIGWESARRDLSAPVAPEDPQACGHCAWCRDGEGEDDGTCEALGAGEPCDICGRRDCLFMAGSSEGSQDGWRLADDASEEAFRRGVEYASGLLKLRPGASDFGSDDFDTAQDEVRAAIRNYADEAALPGGIGLRDAILDAFLPNERVSNPAAPSPRVNDPWGA